MKRQLKKKSDKEKVCLTDLGRKALFDAYEFSFEVTEAILLTMDEKGVSRADFAREMGVSRSYVTQLLEGSVNITLRKLVEVCHALEVNPRALLARKFADFAPKANTPQIEATAKFKHSPDFTGLLSGNEVKIVYDSASPSQRIYEPQNFRVVGYSGQAREPQKALIA